jgi:hypothetical protein
VEATGGTIWCQYAGLAVALVIGIAVSGCSTSPAPDASPAATPTGEGEMAAADILQVLQKHEDELMDIPGVVGLGIGQSETTGEQYLSVLVEAMTPELLALLPTQLDGFEVKAQAVGPIQAQVD